jgi:hypothetical protein
VVDDYEMLYGLITDSLYYVGTDPTENTALLTVLLLLNADSLLWKLFTALLPSNGNIYSFHYSGFQPSCHIAPCLRLHISSSLQEYCHFFFQFEGTNLLKVACAPTVPTHKLSSLFFHIGRGLFHHNVLTFVFSSLLKDRTVSFMTSSCKVCFAVSSYFPDVAVVLRLNPLCHCRMFCPVPYKREGPHGSLV